MPVRVFVAAALLLLAALLPLRSATTLAQGGPPRVDEITAALNWLIGRWRMPVTCVREDGTTVDIHDAIVIKPAMEDAAGRTLRVVFFGIDVADARRCYNLIDSHVPDRRGVLYLTYVSQLRFDVGLTRLRKTLEDGGISYEITRGNMRIRHFGEPESDPVMIDFTKKDATLDITLLRPNTDGYKLLKPLAKSEDADRHRLRRLIFDISGTESDSFRGYYLEDQRTRR